MSFQDRNAADDQAILNAIEEATNRANDAINACLAATDEFGPKARRIAKETERRLPRLRTQSDRNQRIREVITQYGTILRTYSQKLETAIGIIHKSWSDIDKYKQHFNLDEYKRTRPGDPNISELINTMDSLRSKVPATCSTLLQMSDEIYKSAGGIEGLKKPCATARRQVKRLCSELKHIEEVLGRHLDNSV